MSNEGTSVSKDQKLESSKQSNTEDSKKSSSQDSSRSHSGKNDRGRSNSSETAHEKRKRSRTPSRERDSKRKESSHHDRYRDKDYDRDKKDRDWDRNNEYRGNRGPPPKKLSVEEKKKLLWGKKKEEAKPTTWQLAEFESSERKQKFLQLIGAKKPVAYDPLNPTIEEDLNPKPVEEEPLPVINGPKPETLTVEGQRKLFEDLERQFVTSIGHSTSGGLGRL